MKVQPNDSPEMEVGELRNATMRIVGAVGSNTIETATVTASGLTIGDVTIDGMTISAPITASQTGTYKAKFTANMSSDETLIGVVRVKVIDSTCESSRDRYN